MAQWVYRHKKTVWRAKQLLKQGNELLDKKAFEEAVQAYQEGVEVLRWVEEEVTYHYENKSFRNTINILQTLWVWLGKAYRDLGEEGEAENCAKKGKHYLELEEECANANITRKERIKAQVKQLFREVIPILGAQVLFLIISIVLRAQFPAELSYINLFHVTVANFLYFFYAIQLRRHFEFDWEEFERTQSHIRVSDRGFVEFCVKYFFLLLVLGLTILMYLLLPVDIVTGNSRSEDLYYLLIIFILCFIPLESLIFGGTGYYKPKAEVSRNLTSQGNEDS